MEKRLITKHQEKVYRCMHHDFEGLSIEETAKKLGVAVTTVYKVITRLKKIAPQLFPILSKTNAIIWKYWFECGLNYKQIAIVVNLTEGAVSKRLQIIKRKMEATKTNISSTNFYRPLSLSDLNVNLLTTESLGINPADSLIIGSDNPIKVIQKF